MVSPQVLAKHGITPETLKDMFTRLPYPYGGQTTGVDGLPDEFLRLCYRVRTRSQDGMLNNFKLYKHYYAMDQAWNAPLRQVSETLVQSLEAPEYTKEVLDKAQELGYSHLISDETDDKTGKKTGRKKLNLPTFFKVFVPLVRAYVTIRAAKLTADRNLTPYFKFEPTVSTPLNRARCEVITDRVEVMSTQLGYKDIGRQAILHTLKYGVQLQFVQEEWWKEEQENEDGIAVIEREGLRYHLPPATRTYWDQAYPISTINSDTGCQFAGYWRVRRFRDVRLNKYLWNTDRIAFNTNNFRADHAQFFNSVYGGCTLAFPQTFSQWQDLDRENNLAHKFYTSDFDDSALILTEHFEKIIPKDDGIGTYPYPVWFRFILGGDGTILYASPLPATGMIFWGYDPEENDTLQTSLISEVAPFQDEVTNLLSQALLSIKQNLANLTFVDSDIVDEDGIKEIENMGERWFRKLNFLRFSGRKTRAAQQDVRYAFGSVKFPIQDVPGILNAINAVLNLLERVLVMSAQEVAGQATHEQSAEEIAHIKQSTSTRLYYTSMQIDRAYDSWKRQLYNFLMAFGDDKIYGQISNDPTYTPELLESLGFTCLHKAESLNSKHYVQGTKKSIQLEYFSSTKDGSERINNTSIATAMLQMLTGVLQNQMMAQVIGPEQAIILMNQVLEHMGLPRDFKLRPMPAGTPPDQMQQWVEAQLVELTKQVKQFVMQGQQDVMKQIGEQLKPLADAVKQSFAMGKDNQQAITKIADILQQFHLDSPPQPQQAQLAAPGNDSSPTQSALTIGSAAA